MLEAGLITAIGAIWILCRFDLRKVAGLAVFIDILAFIVLPMIFIGTYAGMVTGMVAGVIISLFLTVLRRAVKPSTPKFVRYEGEVFPRFRWM